MKIKVTTEMYENSNEYSAQIEECATALSLYGREVARVSEPDGELQVDVGGRKIMLSSDEAEYVVTALLAHQRAIIGYQATIDEREVHVRSRKQEARTHR